MHTAGGFYFTQRRRPITGKTNKLKYTSAAKMQEAVDAYFADCEGHPLTDENGDAVLNKNGSPVIVGAHPPTVTGLALWLGFKTRQSLLNYQHRSDKFNDILTVAKSKCEEYAERRLYDRDGVNGAKFSPANNFKGWSEKPDQSADKSDKELPQLYNALMEADENDVH